MACNDDDCIFQNLDVYNIFACIASMFCLSKMRKITKCIYMPEIGCLYVVRHADHEFLFEIQYTYIVAIDF